MLITSYKNILQEHCQKNNIILPTYKSHKKGLDHDSLWATTINMKNISFTTDYICKKKIESEQLAAKKILELIGLIMTEDSATKGCPLWRVGSFSNEDNPNSKIINSITSVSQKAIKKENKDKKENDIQKKQSIPKEIPTKILPVKIYKPEQNTQTATVSTSSEENIHKIPTQQSGCIGIKFSDIEYIYIIDLENIPAFNKNTNKLNSIYIGFHNSFHHSVKKYENWHRCKTYDIEYEFVKSEKENKKFIYFVEGQLTDLVDHYMTMFIYPLVSTVMLYGDNVKEIYVVSGDKAGFCTSLLLKKLLESEWCGEICPIKVTNIRDF